MTIVEPAVSVPVSGGWRIVELAVDVASGSVVAGGSVGTGVCVAPVGVRAIVGGIWLGAMVGLVPTGFVALDSDELSPQATANIDVAAIHIQSASLIEKFEGIIWHL